jgi:HrpA-like RNA helicase
MDNKQYKFNVFSYNNVLYLYCSILFVQKLIFDKPEPGVRKIVLATNLAETSITINDVVFVIDCGKAKETSYDALNNTPCLLPTWISKASARQVIFSFLLEYD